MLLGALYYIVVLAFLFSLSYFVVLGCLHAFYYLAILGCLCVLCNIVVLGCLYVFYRLFKDSIQVLNDVLCMDHTAHLAFIDKWVKWLGVAA